MQITINLRTRQRALPGVIVIVIILITLRWAPGAAVPLGLGGCAVSYLGASQRESSPITRPDKP